MFLPLNPRYYFLGIALLVPFISHTQTLNVMSYNIRLDIASDSTNAWPFRREALANQVAWCQPDILGVQEGQPHQLSYLREHLHGYDFVGIGRRGKLGDEATAIFYKRDKYQVLNTNTFWLSPTPDMVSIAWGASYPRIATYALVKDRATGEQFFVVNTHLDHQSDQSRQLGLELILRTIDSVAPASIPVILMGDFNATPETDLIRKFEGRYTDALEALDGPRLGPSATFSGFDASKNFDRRIDYIFYRHNPRIRVKRYATLTSISDTHFLSDHLPVMAELQLSSKPIAIGHRGARGHATENSLVSVQAAIDLGVDMMEIDVFRLDDGEIVVFHDAELERLTDGIGKIEDLTVPELNQLILDGAHKVPRLRDVLTLIDTRTRLNVELKGENTADGTYNILKGFVENHGYKWEDFAISSFRYKELRRMRELHPTIDIGILPTGTIEDAMKVGEEIRARSINPNYEQLTQTNVDALHAAGFLIFPWTVNNQEDIDRITALGVDGIITDFPERVRK